MAAQGLDVTPKFLSQASHGRRSRLRKVLRTIATVAVAVGFPAAAFGQFGQTGAGFGQTQTGFGQTGGLGQTGQTGTGFGQAGGLGLADSLSSGLGQSGQNGFGANPFGVGGLSGQALTPYGRNGLIGTSTTGGATGGTGGSGANAGGALGAANNLGGLTGAALNNRSIQSSLGGLGGGRNAMGRGGFNQQNQNQNSAKSKVRATVTLGFEVAAPTSAAASRVVNDRLRRIPSPLLSGITVEMSGRTAIIRGQVNSPADGKVIERLLSLEPGIDGVKNELTYATGQAPAKPTPSKNNSSSSNSSSSQQSNQLPTADEPSAGISAVQIAPEVVPAPAPK